MMKHALAALLLLTTSAVAEDCATYKLGNVTVTLFDGGHMTVFGPSGEDERCGLVPWTEEGMEHVLHATCEGDWSADVVFASATPSGTEPDLLVMMPFGVLYRSCP